MRSFSFRTDAVTAACSLWILHFSKFETSPRNYIKASDEYVLKYWLKNRYKSSIKRIMAIAWQYMTARRFRYIEDMLYKNEHIKANN